MPGIFHPAHQNDQTLLATGIRMGLTVGVEGMAPLVDLGDRKLEIIAVPGHTPGSIVIFDPATGNLFTGDSLGNNSNLPPDVLWMQWPRQPPLDQYFAAVRTARVVLGGRVKLIMTGHNDRPLVGTAYLDNVETALQRAMDEGTAAWFPPTGLRACGKSWSAIASPIRTGLG